jgi:hypothetical protein
MTKKKERRGNSDWLSRLKGQMRVVDNKIIEHKGI